MAQVIVRNLDAHVVDALKLRAETHGHSLEQELRDLLTGAARPARVDMLRMVDRIRAMTPRKTRSDSTELIRQMRDEQ